MPRLSLLSSAGLFGLMATATVRLFLAPPAGAFAPPARGRAPSMTTSSSSSSSDPFVKHPGQKGKILVLGGSGFLGGTVARRAALEGYEVVSLSRRGAPDRAEGDGGKKGRRKGRKSGNGGGAAGEQVSTIDYRTGDARDRATLEAILDEGGFVGVVHAVGLLFDQSSGLASLNRLASGSGSRPDEESTYDAITRQTAFNAIDAAESYAQKGWKGAPGSAKKAIPFVFLSAAEAGWPDVPGGKFVENNLAPGWLKRYLSAKRSVEGKLEDARRTGRIRPVIFRPSLIYSLDKPASLPPVAAFFAGNRIGLPFVDRPVTVQALSCAIVRAIGRDNVVGVQRYMDVDALSQ